MRGDWSRAGRNDREVFKSELTKEQVKYLELFELEESSGFTVVSIRGERIATIKSTNLNNHEWILVSKFNPKGSNSTDDNWLRVKATSKREPKHAYALLEIGEERYHIEMNKLYNDGFPSSPRRG